MCELNNMSEGARTALLNAGLNQAMVAASQLGTAYSGVDPNLGILKNPFEVPMQLVLTVF